MSCTAKLLSCLGTFAIAISAILFTADRAEAALRRCEDQYDCDRGNCPGPYETCGQTPYLECSCAEIIA